MTATQNWKGICYFHFSNDIVFYHVQCSEDVSWWTTKVWYLWEWYEGTSLSVCLSVCLSVYLFICVYLSVCLSPVCVPLYVYQWLSMCLSIYLWSLSQRSYSLQILNSQVLDLTDKHKEVASQLTQVTTEKENLVQTFHKLEESYTLLQNELGLKKAELLTSQSEISTAKRSVNDVRSVCLSVCLSVYMSVYL